MNALPDSRRSITRGQAARWGLIVVELLIGYEWLVSGLNKVLNRGFFSGMSAQLQQQMDGNPNVWYATLVKNLVLPHATLFGFLVEYGELLVALGFFVAAALWMTHRMIPRQLARLTGWGVIVALIGGALMTMNYYIMAGKTLPFLTPDHPFDEGINLDGLLTLITVGLIVIHVLLMRRRTRTDVVADRAVEDFFQETKQA